MWLRVLNSTGTQFSRVLLAQKYINVLQGRTIKRWVAPTLHELYKRKKFDKTGIQPRNTYLEWNFDAELYAFGKRLNEDFDSNILQRAFTFKSYITQEEELQKQVGIEAPEFQLKDNSQMIDDGETLMSYYIEAYLKLALPKFPDEGILAVKKYLMSTDMLSEISHNLGTKDIIFCNEYPVGKEVLEQTLKAIVAALAHSSGAERAAHFVRDFVITALNGVDINELWPIEKPMEMLEQMLAKSGKTPEPRLIGQIGKNTLMACYRVGIYIDKEMFCYGFGENVDIAVEMAAREALKLLFNTRENMAPINFKIEGIPKEASNRIRLASG